jgi:hypothetical protein
MIHDVITYNESKSEGRRRDQCFYILLIDMNPYGNSWAMITAPNHHQTAAHIAIIGER